VESKGENRRSEEGGKKNVRSYFKRRNEEDLNVHSGGDVIEGDKEGRTATGKNVSLSWAKCARAIWGRWFEGLK